MKCKRVFEKSKYLTSGLLTGDILRFRSSLSFLCSLLRDVTTFLRSFLRIVWIVRITRTSWVIGVTNFPLVLSEKMRLSLITCDYINYTRVPLRIDPSFGIIWKRNNSSQVIHITLLLRTVIILVKRDFLRILRYS